MIREHVEVIPKSDRTMPRHPVVAECVPDVSGHVEIVGRRRKSSEDCGRRRKVREMIGSFGRRRKDREDFRKLRLTDQVMSQYVTNTHTTDNCRWLGQPKCNKCGWFGHVSAKCFRNKQKRKNENEE